MGVKNVTISATPLEQLLHWTFSAPGGSQRLILPNLPSSFHLPQVSDQFLAFSAYSLSYVQ